MREQRKVMAAETVKIQQQGYYITPGNRRIDITDAQKHAENDSYLITPEEGRLLMSSLAPPDNAANPHCEVINQSTVQAIVEASQTGAKLAVLNFASAKNPGGGFINGAMAQEEALSMCSGLYATQLCHEAYYESNRACKTMMYTHHAIYSPDVVFFRDARYALLESPVTASVLTLPAVNMGQVRQKREDINQAKAVMKERMRLALTILAKEKNQTIILGAYGCGVFGNDPQEVAQGWRELLYNEGLGGYFNTVLFVILDKPGGANISAFTQIFGEARNP